MYYVQPYNPMASGFYFQTMAEYDKAYQQNRDDYGNPIGEYEIQFMDGDTLDCKLFDAIQISQATIHLFIKKIDEWSDDNKIRILIADEAGYDIKLDTIEPDDLDIDIYHDMTMYDLAISFVDEGLFGDIPETLIIYLDYDKIARDLSMDYTQTHIDHGLTS